MSEQKARVITEEGKLCFDQNLFEANDDGKFQASMVLGKGVNYKNISELMMATAKAKHGDNIPKKFTWGMKSDKDADTEKYPFLKDGMLVSGGTKFAIPVTDIAGNVITKDDIKGGDTVRFSLSAYCYEFKGKHGVSLNVNAILLIEKCSEENAFYKKQNAADMFGDVFTSYENKSVDMFANNENEAEDTNLSDMNF